mgnify:CR=1 FL=1
MSAFSEGLTGQELQAVDAGEGFGTYPSAQSTFQNSIAEGRFVKLDTGSIDALDNSATPLIAGVLLRNISGAIESNGLTDTTYQTSVQVIEDGYVTIDIQASAVPTALSKVYLVNSVADSGKVTQDSAFADAIAVDAYFVREVKTGVWLIKINKIAGA